MGEAPPSPKTIMPEQQQFTRWRALGNPISPLDPIQPDSPLSRLEEGRLPHSLVLLLFDGNALRGPMRFANQQEADSYLQMQPGVRGYLILPSYDAD
jgi:hypothetical protein